MNYGPSLRYVFQQPVGRETKRDFVQISPFIVCCIFHLFPYSISQRLDLEEIVNSVIVYIGSREAKHTNEHKLESRRSVCKQQLRSTCLQKLSMMYVWISRSPHFSQCVAYPLWIIHQYLRSTTKVCLLYGRRVLATMTIRWDIHVPYIKTNSNSCFKRSQGKNDKRKLIDKSFRERVDPVDTQITSTSNC